VSDAEPSAKEPPPKQQRLRRWALQLGLVVAVYLAVSAWREREMPSTNEPAPPFALTTLSGERVQLADLAGKTVLLHFWATWCGVCKAEISTLKTIQENLDSDEVLLTVVASNDRDEVQRFASERQLSYPILMATAELLTSYGVSAFPTNYIIDPRGRIHHKSVGLSTRLGLGARMGCAGR
jgi:peroxiredoxin